MINQLDKIKLTFFNYYQNKSLDVIRKINITSQSEMSKIIEEASVSNLKSEILQYYNEKLSTSTMDNIDRLFYHFLETEIKDRLPKV